ncbi:hypothetical protein HQ590_08925 [bacterium]|nr:hypothetical protein [bacterium]
MISTRLSLSIGLAGCLTAWLVAWVGRVDPHQFGAWDAAVLCVSGIMGTVATGWFAGVFCHHSFQRWNAYLAFACSFFVAVYTPILVLAVHAPFHRWALSDASARETAQLGPLLARAIEQTGWVHFGGLFVIVCLGVVAVRKLETDCQLKGGQRRRLWEALDRVDYLLGGIALPGVMMLAHVMGARFQSVITWIGLLSGWFLLVILLRSLRLHRNSLKETIPMSRRPVLPLGTGAAGMATGLLGLAVLLAFLRVLWQRPSVGLLGILATAGVLGVLYRRMVGGTTPEDLRRAIQVSAFMTRLAVWSAIGISLAVGGLVLPGIARSAIRQASEVPQPMAIVFLVATPWYATFGLLGAGAYAGAFVFPILLPRSVHTTEQVGGAVQSGCVLGGSSFLFLVLYALHLALCGVPFINAAKSNSPVEQPAPVDIAGGDWQALGLLYLGWLVAFVSATAIVCVLGTLIDNAIAWGVYRGADKCRQLWRRLRCA